MGNRARVTSSSGVESTRSGGIAGLVSGLRRRALGRSGGRGMVIESSTKTDLSGNYQVSRPRVRRRKH